MGERAVIERVAGRGIPVTGDDVDTDRIIPARFLICITFEGLGAHAFEDDRAQKKAAGGVHPFDDARFAGASILVVSKNFGCGSSREHAPQALKRWGIRAVVGESFSEIFFGNSVALGMPCVTLSASDARALQVLVAKSPETPLVLDLKGGAITSGTTGAATFPIAIPAGAREAFLSGRWDATSLLLERFEEVRAVAAKLESWR